ncbi:hypothetical protein QJS10_CPA01g02138 [Acorus calamus]|uniref:Protein kinase domain-containing protein n=1 Tax=Acorus calamus TaxID=4465 RepID=A0AAV9FJ42_ACOCL|nr:hypothetical protein QJS10_CPA01g02138 [Acorus calamus]
MSLNMKTLTQAFAKTAAVIEKTVQTTVQEVTGPRPLQDYDLLDQVGSGGPGLAWKLYSARSRTGSGPQQYPTVCVWVLDKRALSEARTRAGLPKAAEDAFLDVVRADAARLVRIRHPGVVHVVQALDESKNAMAMVTEPLFASVANVLGEVDNVVKVPKELKGMKMGLLEIKHGLLQVAETLDFLHNNARLIHRAISPETVYITASGAWKLGGFGFSISTDQALGDSTSVPPFHYSEYDVEDSVLPLQPSLNYTSPELVHNKPTASGCSSDIFSFGCLAYHLIARKPLLDCHNNVKMYMNSLTYLSHEAFSSIPSELTSDLRRMLSVDENARPAALDFTGSPFFREDTRLRALRFLDHMLERDNMQKTEFLKSLSDMWKEFDSRVLRYKVLPPLCAELRNMVMQPMILPMVLTIAESQDKVDFELSTLPALVPVFSSAAGETLLLLVKHSELIMNKTSQDQLISHVLPLLVRAYDDTDARMQEEALRRTVSLAKQIDSQLVKQAILPRVHGLALKTTVAAVRVNALRCLGDLVTSLDKNSVMDILQTLHRCTDVDHSAPTLMCTLGVANSVYKQYGIEFAAEHVLPLLLPLLIAQQLSVQQFAKYMLFVKDILRKIEEKCGVSVTDSGTPEIRPTLSVLNGMQSDPFQKSSGNSSSARSSSTWDEDWGPISKPPSSSSSHPSESTLSTKPAMPVSHITSVTSSLMQPPISTHSQQSSKSCPAVEIEWPPPASTDGFATQSGDIERLTNPGKLSDSTFDDIDPFANWPPRPSTSMSSLSSASKSSHNHLNAGSIMSSQSNILSVGNNNPIRLSNQHQGTTTNGTGYNAQNSLAIQKQGDGFLRPSSGMYTNKQAADIGTIFGPSNGGQGQAPMRLAPPPPAPAGRGRGRNGRLSGPSRASQSKVHSEQPPILDLL